MDIVDELLKKAGYCSKREVDLSDVLQMYTKYGYIYTDEQLEFLNKYCYLKIEYIHPIWNESVLLDINPIKAQRPIEINTIQNYNDYLHDELLIIGEVEAEEMTLYLSKKGYFFGCFDDSIIKWGNDFKKMLLYLVKGKKGKYMMLD